MLKSGIDMAGVKLWGNDLKHSRHLWTEFRGWVKNVLWASLLSASAFDWYKKTWTGVSLAGQMKGTFVLLTFWRMEQWRTGWNLPRFHSGETKNLWSFVKDTAGAYLRCFKILYWKCAVHGRHKGLAHGSVWLGGWGVFQLSGWSMCQDERGSDAS